MSDEKRRYKRIKNDLNVRAIVPDAGQGLSGMITVKTRNVSATGVLFFSKDIFEIGTVINVKFLKPKSFDFFEGDAKVVRVEIPQDGNGYEIGVQFVELSSADEKKLNYYLDEE